MTRPACASSLERLQLHACLSESLANMEAWEVPLSRVSRSEAVAATSIRRLGGVPSRVLRRYAGAQAGVNQPVESSIFAVKGGRGR